MTLKDTPLVTNDQIFWSIQTTARMLDISISSVHRLAKYDPDFPRKLYLTGRVTGWRSEEIRKWLLEHKS